MLAPLELKFLIQTNVNSKRHANRWKVGHVFNISFFLYLSKLSRGETAQTQVKCLVTVSGQQVMSPVTPPQDKGGKTKFGRG